MTTEKKSKKRIEKIRVTESEEDTEDSKLSDDELDEVSGGVETNPSKVATGIRGRGMPSQPLQPNTPLQPIAPSHTAKWPPGGISGKKI